MYNFSLARLHALTLKGLYSSPTRGLARFVQPWKLNERMLMIY